MGKLMIKLGKVLVAFSFLITLTSANTTCAMILGQDELPEEAKSMRKF